MKRLLLLASMCIAGPLVFFSMRASSAPPVSPLRFRDASGFFASTVTGSSSVDLNGPFFQNLGSNGRTCGTCHAPSDAFTITPTHLQQRFAQSQGTDPVFRPNDGAVCPTADVSSVPARMQAYKLLLNRGLIRISLAIPATADFTLESVNDPYSCATPGDMSLYRRPLPSTNLRFLPVIMWDGREKTFESQVIDATTGHAQGAVPSADQINAIVAFEKKLHSTQEIDDQTGMLGGAGATGGPTPLSKQSFYVGINDVLGADPTGAAFTPTVFTLFDSWQNSPNARRAAVARGQDIFNHRAISITGVKGLNDKLGVDSLAGTCTTCHDSPNVGNHSVPFPIDIGVSSFDPDGTALSYLPQYHFRCTSGEEVVTTDPGRAMVTGKCADLGKMKGPILRNLAARPPYFHNGRAQSLDEVVDFYNQRFSLGLTQQEHNDLVAFLKAL